MRPTNALVLLALCAVPLQTSATRTVLSRLKGIASQWSLPIGSSDPSNSPSILDRVKGAVVNAWCNGEPCYGFLKQSQDTVAPELKPAPVVDEPDARITPTAADLAGAEADAHRHPHEPSHTWGPDPFVTTNSPPGNCGPLGCPPRTTGCVGSGCWGGEPTSSPPWSPLITSVPGDGNGEGGEGEHGGHGGHGRGHRDEL